MREQRKKYRRVKAFDMVVILIAVLVIGTAAAGFCAAEVSAASKSDNKRTASLEPICKGSDFFDYRSESGEYLYDYDTLQGACANDGFAYLTLYNRLVEKSKIVKVNLTTLKVVKVSRVLPIYHANNLTYNTRRDLILATCCTGKKKRAVFIDPDTLKVVDKKDIRLTGKVKNLPASERRVYKGFAAIAYNEKRDCYVGKLKNTGNVIIFDGKLRPVRYIKLAGKRKYLLNQGIETYGKYIYDVRSFQGSHKYNMVTVHTFSGRLVGLIKVPVGKSPGMELECVFHDGGKFYAGFYRTTSLKHDTMLFNVKRDNMLYLASNIKWR